MTLEHYHCPNECEKPQPIEVYGELACGRCWHKFHEFVLVVECNAETCPDDVQMMERLRWSNERTAWLLLALAVVFAVVWILRGC